MKEDLNQATTGDILVVHPCFSHFVGYMTTAQAKLAILYQHPRMRGMKGQLFCRANAVSHLFDLGVDGLRHSVHNGKHHGGGGGVRDPHRQEHRREHEAQHQAGLARSNLRRTHSNCELHTRYL